jgi:hypothetical protein
MRGIPGWFRDPPSVGQGGIPVYCRRAHCVQALRPRGACEQCFDNRKPRTAPRCDNVSQVYLVEPLQGMLEHQVITGYYPHLSLASDQRFVSKGGFLVRFASPGGTTVFPETPWTVP